MVVKVNRTYDDSYENLIAKIFADWDLMKADILKSLKGVYLPSKRARVKSVEITKALKEFRERSAEETLKIIGENRATK